MACATSGAGNTASLTVNVLKANAMYYVVVDGQGTAPNDTKGTFTITVRP